MKRRHFFPSFCICVLTCGFAEGKNPPGPKPFDGGGVTGLDLRTQLQKGLKARRPVEFEYIDQIIELVEEGKLPRKLVVTTYLAAQQQSRRQLQYFQLALAARARGLDVKLPNLRLQAVGISGNGGTHGVNTPPIPPF
jgi:hypothetical protein